MSKPKITVSILKMNCLALYKAFYAVAGSKDFKSVFELQTMVKGFHMIQSAIAQHCTGNPAFVKSMEDYANDDQNYNSIMLMLIGNTLKFANVIIPTRDCDFFVNDDTCETYFWIDERIELSVDKSNRLSIAKLMIDDKSDILLFNNGMDNWVQYDSEEVNSFSFKAAHKYKEYLAEKQLLKD
jgi:hypothetical protein